jgi:hypothetical protein
MIPVSRLLFLRPTTSPSIPSKKNINFRSVRLSLTSSVCREHLYKFELVQQNFSLSIVLSKKRSSLPSIQMIVQTDFEVCLAFIMTRLRIKTRSRVMKIRRVVVRAKWKALRVLFEVQRQKLVFFESFIAAKKLPLDPICRSFTPFFSNVLIYPNVQESLQSSETLVIFENYE